MKKEGSGEVYESFAIFLDEFDADLYFCRIGCWGVWLEVADKDYRGYYNWSSYICCQDNHSGILPAIAFKVF